MPPSPDQSKETIETIYRIVELVLIPLLWKIYQAIDKLKEETSTLKTILIGVDGKNGIRSRVLRLEKSQHQTAIFLARVVGSHPKMDNDESEEEL